MARPRVRSSTTRFRSRGGPARRRPACLQGSASSPHELWAWTITAAEAPGAADEPRADVRRLTTIVAGAPGQAPDAFNEAILAHFAGCRARDVLGPGGGGPGTGGTGAAGGPTPQDGADGGPSPE